MDITTVPSDSWELLKNGITEVVHGVIIVVKWVVSYLF